MVITNLQEKENRKLWVPIRGGNRGGWSLFNWQDVRDMPYKDRQMYLGNSVTIGVLDKGGKWRRRDWYMKTDKKYKSDNLTSEQQEAVKRDYQRMNAALGITEKQDEQKLTENQMRELMKKIKMKKQGYEEPIAPEAIGMGFDKAKVEIRSKPSATIDNPHRLEAFDDFQPLQKQEKKQRQKKQKKHKKQKKDKKQKKKKDRQHKHRHRDNSQEKKQKKHKKDKHKKRDHEEKQQRKRDRSRSLEKSKRKRYSSSESRSSSSD